MATKTRIATPQGSGYANAFQLQLYQFPGTVGNVFFVDSTSAAKSDTAGFGYSPDAPFATLAYALGSTGPTTANNGDTVVCCPGHTEAVIGDGTISAAVAGVRVLGVGTGRLRPVITYTTAVAASVNLNSANCQWDNIVFSGVGVDAVTAMVNVKAADVWLTNCEFELANATNQATVGLLTTTAANRMLISNCHFHGTNNAGTTNAIQINGTSDTRILENVIYGAFSGTLGAIQIITTAAVNLIIGRNKIQNLTAANTKVIVDTITGSTGQIFENKMQILSGTAPITAAGMSWVGQNYYANAVATAGTLI